MNEWFKTVVMLLALIVTGVIIVQVLPFLR